MPPMFLSGADCGRHCLDQLARQSRRLLRALDVGVMKDLTGSYAGRTLRARPACLIAAIVLRLFLHIRLAPTVDGPAPADDRNHSCMARPPNLGGLSLNASSRRIDQRLILKALDRQACLRRATEDALEEAELIVERFVGGAAAIELVHRYRRLCAQTRRLFDS